MSNVSVGILSCTGVVLLVMLLYIIVSRRKTIFHLLFAAIIVELLVWTVAVSLAGFWGDDPARYVFLDNFTYLGATTVPVSILLLGITYSKELQGFKAWHLLLAVIPLITIIMIFTNDYHHLFYQSYSPETGYVVGPYFFVHSIYSYTCLIIGMVMLCSYAVRTSGILSIQAILNVVASIIPTVVNICYTLGVPGFSSFSTPVAFACTVLLYLISMMRFNLLKVVPIALQTVVNQISDCFVVTDDQLNILDCNRAFRERFGSSAPKVSKYQNPRLDDFLLTAGLPPERAEGICATIRMIAEDGMRRTEDICIHFESECFFVVEYTLVAERGRQSAIVVLFKDVTQHVLDLRALERNQDILLERERLASLGQMIGGIAHNMKTPILSVSGGIDQLQCLTEEYRSSIGDSEVTTADHREIAEEMDVWLAKMKLQMSYMSDIISTVKDQATQMSVSSGGDFTIDELLKRVGILMHHSLIKSNCTLQTVLDIEGDSIIYGNINSLIQILDNIIANAIQSYEDGGGVIRLQVSEKEGDCLFAITDEGSGIEPVVQKALFKEMITTKGKHGTGLGLYMSHSTIRGMFRGNMWFESNLGTGTTFFVQIPFTGEGEYA